MDVSSQKLQPSTSRSSSQRKAEEASALLAAIVESSDDAIISCTLDGIITSWNGGAERIFGYNAEEIIGQPTSILASAKAREDYSSILKKIRHGERVHHYETYRRHKDSSDLFIFLTVSPVCNSSGKIIGASKVARDITSSRHAEQALRNADKLALAGRMSASIAHEINNPLEAITNLLFLLQQEKISEQGQEYLELAQSELGRVTRIVSQTLSFFRGGAEPALSPLSVIVESAIALHTGRLLVSNIAIETDYLPTSPLLCHQGEMRQLLANLISNALDAITSKGRLCVRIRPATSTTTGTQGIRLTVADTGTGMTPTTRRLLFEPFYTTKGSAGTGLGLWVTRQIVQHHKGRISVRSSQSPDHHGTVFSLFFPYPEAASLQQASNHEPLTIATDITSHEDESRHTHAGPDQPSIAYNAA
jgi:PAS domain S-box-containing protein